LSDHHPLAILQKAALGDFYLYPSFSFFRSSTSNNVHPIETGYCHRSLLRNGNYHDISGFAIRFSIVNSVSLKAVA
jgi:hypothetical protein